MAASPTTAGIPAPVLHADQVHHEILARTPFSRHLNPQNAPAAHQAFLGGYTDAPLFVYQPLTQADEILAKLDAVEPPRDHPAGALVGRCMDNTRSMVVALRDRSAQAFAKLALECGWNPDPDLLALHFPTPQPDPQPFDVSARQLVARLEDALKTRDMGDWQVCFDRVMAARVLVDGSKHLLRVNPDSRFCRRDLHRLVAHEIDVHAWRSHAGQSQALRCFETGLPGALATDEGLAMLAEEQVGLSSPGVLYRQVEVVRAIDLARRMGFREVYMDLLSRVSPGLAWGICLRIKRGLAHPECPGVYAKDSVYLSGWKLVGDWLKSGGDIRHLYVGKVSVTDPV
ncbi:MAG: DUF1704 domain-containing protein, partial [Oligoflexia bacterium]|nr:DUF1704 domain-containing protein [Oligoflexia bacterium]